MHATTEVTPRDTVGLRELKKKEALLESVNTAMLRILNPVEVAWDLDRAGEAEMDEMWSFVGNKGNPRWLWHAMNWLRVFANAEASRMSQGV